MDESLIFTFCAWQNAIEIAAEKGIKFHPAWAADFYVFLADLGTCPDDDGELVLRMTAYGYTPNNCLWKGME